MAHFLESPVAIQLCAASPDLHPASTRAFGCRVEEDARTLRLSVLEAQAKRFLKALDTGERVAVNFGHVVDFRSVQVKGTRLEVRAADETERQAVRDYTREFKKMMGRVGVPEEACQGLFHSGPVVVVRVRADVLFEQTPGPGAGARLEATWPRL
jgi:hypothetical protein